MSLNTFRVVWQTFRAYRLHLAVLVVLGFVGAFLEGIGINAAVPLFSFLLGGGSPSGDIVSHTLQLLAGVLHVPFTFRVLLSFIFILFTLRAVSVVVFGYVRGLITTDFFTTESRAMLKRVLHASWPFFLRQKIGMIQNSLVRDIQRTASLLDATSQVIQSFSGATMYVVVAVVISPATTLFTLIGGGMFLALVRPLLGRIQRTAQQMAATEKDVSQSLAQQIIGMKSIKAARVEEGVFAEAGAFMQSLKSQQMGIAFAKALSGALLQPFTLFFISVAFYVSYHSAHFNLISFGATLYLIQKIFVYLESGMAGLQAMNEVVPYAQSLKDFEHSLGTHAEGRLHGSADFVFEKEIRFADIGFGYQEGAPVLRGVNFTVRPGEMLALIGPSGAGKTSLADLVLRLFEPTAGAIYVDGIDATEISLESWRKHFAYVSQDPFLFNGTLEENIRFYREGITRESIEEAARQANIYDFIMELPNGFDTLVGDRGVMLSGGQRQRVVLARALAGNPQVLVLDEATSALDSDSERLIQESIRALHGQVAVFIIAHRLSTVEKADTIIVLERGEVVERGTPQDLLANPESYFARHGGRAA